MTKRLIIIGAAVMTTLSALLLLWQFRTTFIYVLASLALTAAVRPLVKRGAAQGRAAHLLVIALYLLTLGGFGLLLFVSGGEVAREVRQLSQQISVQDEWRQPEWVVGQAFQQQLDLRLPPPSELFGALIGDQGEFVLPAVLGITESIVTIISGTIIVLFLSVYWSINQIHFERLWLSLLPPDQRTRTREIWHMVEADIGAYIRNEVIQSVMAGGALGVGYWLLGSPYPTLLAFIGALAWLIPVVGILLAVIAPFLIGLLTGVSLSVVSVLYTVAVLLILALWVEPRLPKRKQHNPILTLIILIALADAFGFFGLVVAPPLSAAFQILWSHLVSQRPVPEAAATVADLKERQANLLTTIQNMAEPPPLALSAMERLTDLLEKAEPVLQEPTRQNGAVHHHLPHLGE